MVADWCPVLKITQLEEIIMNYVVTIKNNKFTFENSGWNTEKMWNDLINALQSMKLASEVEIVEFLAQTGYNIYE